MPWRAAAMTFKLNDKELHDYLVRAKRFATKPTAMMRAVGLEAEALIQESFREGRAPDGERWKPLAVRRGASKRAARRRGNIRARQSDQPLRDTGALMRSVSHRASVQAVRAGVTKKYGGYHQTGTKHIPRRPFLPDAGKPLPPEWQRRLQAAADAAAEKKIRD